ncbi:MAG: WxcM-like domain-containing protein [Sphingobacteriales bacterium]|nr:MAG: WxcM-like domain-containing protein [Sphingobacteriales bacterium]
MAYFINLQTFTDNRGSLNSVDKVLPFDIKRVYYIYGIEPLLERGGHRHIETVEALICMHGSCRVHIDNGTEKKQILLDDPSQCLIVEPGDYHLMDNFGDNTILLGIASTHHDKADYINEPYNY